MADTCPRCCSPHSGPLELAALAARADAALRAGDLNLGAAKVRAVATALRCRAKLCGGVAGGSIDS